MTEEEPTRISGIERVPGEWQPIASAPKDGTQVIVLVGERIYLSEWRDEETRSFGKVTNTIQCWVWPHYWLARGDFEPTHWLPLPEAPASKEATNGDMAAD